MKGVIIITKIDKQLQLQISRIRTCNHSLTRTHPPTCARTHTHTTVCTTL